MKKLSNLKISEVRIILKNLDLTLQRCKGGHEMWAKEGMLRPVVLQNHIEPVPEFIIKNIIRTIGTTKEEFLDALKH